MAYYRSVASEDSIRNAFDAQFRAGLNMLEAAVRACPDEAWDSAEQVNRFWHIAYHTLFYVHLYLFRTVAEHRPWSGHRDGAEDLGKEAAPYTRENILEFLAFCRGHARRQITGLQPAPSPAPHRPARRTHPPNHRHRRTVARPRLILVRCQRC